MGKSKLFGYLTAAIILVGCGRAPVPSTVDGGIAGFNFEPLSLGGCVVQTITDQLKCVPGLTFTEITGDPTTPAGYRRFDLQFEQPVDHALPRGTKFKQKLVLMHKAEAEPLILQTSGYAIFRVSLSAVARQFGANQIQVEHRFFDTSVPADKDWTKLDIRQSAADFHRITLAFRQIYTGKWLNTGASKGGMTSVYHRRFFPSDLDGTLAYVAPLSFSTEDERYVTFVDQAGGARWAACRTQLAELQKGLLEHRSEIVPNLGGTYQQLGSASVAFEHSIIELPFAFW